MFLWYLKTSKNLGQDLTQKNKTTINVCLKSFYPECVSYFIIISLLFYYINSGVTFYLVCEFYYQVYTKESWCNGEGGCFVTSFQLHFDRPWFDPSRALFLFISFNTLITKRRCVKLKRGRARSNMRAGKIYM